MLKHKLVGHWLAGKLRWIGFKKLSYKLHDYTFPEHHMHIWDLD